MRNRFLNTSAAAAAIALATAGAAQAQSSSGNIAGEGVAGETIVVHGPDNGFHRELHLDEDGKFTIRRVPTGEYTVVRVAPDGSAGTSQTIYIKVGSTARVQ
jgi:hypothetical protein